MSVVNNYKSDEERFFSAWCKELEDAEIIDWWGYEVDTFMICDEQRVGWRKLRNLTYTADFSIKWKVIPTFVQSIATQAKNGLILHSKGVSYIDVKGGGFSGKYYNSDITFPIIQKILLYDKWIWVDKFIVSNKKGSGFDRTFTPKAYLETPTGKEKLLHYHPLTIEDVEVYDEDKLLL